MWNWVGIEEKGKCQKANSGFAAKIVPVCEPSFLFDYFILKTLMTFWSGHFCKKAIYIKHFFKILKIVSHRLSRFKRFLINKFVN